MYTDNYLHFCFIVFVFLQGPRFEKGQDSIYSALYYEITLDLRVPFTKAFLLFLCLPFS